MAMFTATDSLQNSNLPSSDAAYVNFSQVSAMLCVDVNLILLTPSGFDLYATYADAPTCQAAAAALVAALG